MIKYIYSVLNSNNPNVFLLKLLLIITFCYFVHLFWMKSNKKTKYEGFTQELPYVLKTNENIYDSFYAEIYDDIHKPEHRVGYELLNIIDVTQPTTRNSCFLDVGSGTGKVVDELREAGYRAYGIDKAKAMVDVAEEKYPESEYQCGDILEPMAFEKGTFSHILCNYFTIYEMSDKRTFFRNCQHWLQPNGYLIVHLVNPDKFDPISPAAKTKLSTNPNKYSDKRITNSIVNFKDFQYKLNYDFGKVKSNVVEVKEFFIDENTSNIRENDNTLFIQSIDEIVTVANTNGFLTHAKFDMKDCNDDENQYIYIFEKI